MPKLKVNKLAPVGAAGPTPSVRADLRKLIRPRRQGPVWEGPTGGGPQGGVTYSLLSRFLVCRERFRVHVVEGLRPRDCFNPRLEFGNMWHVCEEARARPVNWVPHLRNYAAHLCRRYPLQQEQIAHWGAVTQALFPLYVEHWSRHPDVMNRTPLLQEQVFDVPYRLPSGRTVRLRGKWDSVDLIGKSKDVGIFLQENKTKSAIDAAKIERQLRFDLQTMTYLIAFERWVDLGETPLKEGTKTTPILGVRYNVVRRSAHKSVESMLKKVGDDRAHGRIGEWFARWDVHVTDEDVTRFRHDCLDPILENLCSWWEHVTDPTGKVFEVAGAQGPYLHWRHPFGVYNVLDEGGSSDLDAYLAGEGEVGLERTSDLFPELTCQLSQSR